MSENPEFPRHPVPSNFGGSAMANLRRQMDEQAKLDAETIDADDELDDWPEMEPPLEIPDLELHKTLSENEQMQRWEELEEKNRAIDQKISEERSCPPS